MHGFHHFSMFDSFSNKNEHEIMLVCRKIDFLQRYIFSIALLPCSIARTNTAVELVYTGTGRFILCNPNRKETLRLEKNAIFRSAVAFFPRLVERRKRSMVHISHLTLTGNCFFFLLYFGEAYAPVESTLWPEVPRTTCGIPQTTGVRGGSRGSNPFRFFVVGSGVQLSLHENKGETQRKKRKIRERNSPARKSEKNEKNEKSNSAIFVRGAAIPI
jgi:hypothetical protein